MQIALEHAGGERAVLVRPRRDRLWIEAEARPGLSFDGIVASPVRASESDIPEGLVRFCLRSKELVLLDDAGVVNQFSSDPYIQRSRCRSILCIPLVRQAESVAVIYVENSLAAHSFTPAHVSLLQLLASQAAISLENASLEEKEALLKEVHHRVKNNLQLVSSLLSLQASQGEGGAGIDAIVDSRNRIHSMALAHENLYRAGNFARIPMSEHVRSLCAHLARVYGGPNRMVQIVTRIENIELDVDRATSCGLIICELVSNAFKHGFPDGRQGVVEIALTQVARDEVELCVHDNGVGASLPDAARVAGPSTRLLPDRAIAGNPALRR